jgi:hypothetical protein
MGRLKQLTHTNDANDPGTSFGSGAIAGHQYEYGGAGRDVLIGGLDADTLDGGDDDDILIAGATSHDADDAALNQILAEWTSARTYQSRVKNIKGIGNGKSDFANRLNGNVFLKKNGQAQTVFDDPVANELTGSSGDDWFLFDVVLDELTDWAPGETKN